MEEEFENYRKNIVKYIVVLSIHFYFRRKLKRNLRWKFDNTKIRKEEYFDVNIRYLKILINIFLVFIYFFFVLFYGKLKTNLRKIREFLCMFPFSKEIRVKFDDTKIREFPGKFCPDAHSVSRFLFSTRIRESSHNLTRKFSATNSAYIIFKEMQWKLGPNKLWLSGLLSGKVELARPAGRMGIPFSSNVSFHYVTRNMRESYENSYENRGIVSERKREKKIDANAWVFFRNRWMVM